MPVSICLVWYAVGAVAYCVFTDVLQQLLHCFSVQNMSVTAKFAFRNIYIRVSDYLLHTVVAYTLILTAPCVVDKITIIGLLLL
jgi:hypothetical protein